jgi:SPP1 gp7 family putative phage head morphogenesis protein
MADLAMGQKAGPVITPAQQFIAKYTNEWWVKLAATTRTRLREALAKMEAEGMTTEQLYDLIEPLFGAQRAVLIAQNEMTNVLGEAARIRYEESGVENWQWNTVNDPFVDEVCRELEGSIFPITEPFEGAHIGCRCFPAPVSLLAPMDSGE